MECGGRASPRAPTPLWLRECGIYGVRRQSESDERRHRFGFGNVEYMECGGRASPTSADTALASGMWNIWSAAAERVRRAATPLWLRESGIYGVRWQSESDERRHRFGFGNLEYMECGGRASPRAPTPLWLRVCGMYGVRWQSESASGDTALASGIWNIWSAVAQRVRRAATPLWLREL